MKSISSRAQSQEVLVFTSKTVDEQVSLTDLRPTQEIQEKVGLVLSQPKRASEEPLSRVLFTPESTPTVESKQKEYGSTFSEPPTSKTFDSESFGTSAERPKPKHRKKTSLFENLKSGFQRLFGAPKKRSLSYEKVVTWYKKYKDFVEEIKKEHRHTFMVLDIVKFATLLKTAPQTLLKYIGVLRPVFN